MVTRSLERAETMIGPVGEGTAAGTADGAGALQQRRLVSSNRTTLDKQVLQNSFLNQGWTLAQMAMPKSWSKDYILAFVTDLQLLFPASSISPSGFETKPKRTQKNGLVWTQNTRINYESEKKVWYSENFKYVFSCTFKSTTNILLKNIYTFEV